MTEAEARYVVSHREEYDEKTFIYAFEILERAQNGHGIVVP